MIYLVILLAVIAITALVFFLRGRSPGSSASQAISTFRAAGLDDAEGTSGKNLLIMVT